ncbi:MULTISPECIES: hypothetical protein [unclassified Bradyrhizobium]
MRDPIGQSCSAEEPHRPKLEVIAAISLERAVDWLSANSGRRPLRLPVIASAPMGYRLSENVELLSSASGADGPLLFVKLQFKSVSFR